MLLRLRTQKEDTREKKSKIIKEKLFRTAVFRKAKTVMFYISIGGEVNTREMIQAAIKLGKTVAVPVCKNNERTIRPCILEDKTRLKKGPYGIYEPVHKTFIDLDDIDLVLVPGIAFDKRGRRLGRGKGGYDYFLKRLPKKTTSIGLAFDFQILPHIPTTKQDTRIQKLIFA